MANTFSPFGFDPYGRQDGASWSENATTYLIAANNTNKLYRGDVCTLLATGVIDILAPGTTPPLGIFLGCNYISASQGRLVYSQYFPGGDTIANGVVSALVVDDPNVVLLAQTGWSAGVPAPATQAMVGMNAQYANGTGQVLTGNSGAYINLNTTPAVTSTLPFRIIGLVADPPTSNGADTATAYNYVRLAWNNHFFKQLAGI